MDILIAVSQRFLSEAALKKPGCSDTQISCALRRQSGLRIRKRTPGELSQCMNEMKNPPEWLSWTIAGATFLAIADMPYGYYQLLRLVVTGYAAYLALGFFKDRQAPWAWGFGFVALLYNPVFIITMSKEIHAIVNLATAVLVAYEFRMMRARQPIDAPPLRVEVLSNRPENLGVSGKGAESRRHSGKFLAAIFALLTVASAIYFISISQTTEPTEQADSAESLAETEIEQPFVMDNQPTMADSGSVVSDILKAPAPVEAVLPALPLFSEFSVVESEVMIPPVITKGSWAWNYRTRIENAFRSPSNFGSNAVVTTWGCGTGCLSGALVDRTTGAAYELPVGGEEQQMLDVKTRQGSNLLLATWNDTSGAVPTCVFEAFEWAAGVFKSQNGFPIKAAGSCPSE